jgi:hypothetical protein
VDFAYQAYLFAAQWLLGHGAPLNLGNPYLAIKNQSEFKPSEGNTSSIC